MVTVERKRFQRAASHTFPYHGVLVLCRCQLQSRRSLGRSNEEGQIAMDESACEGGPSAATQRLASLTA